MPVWEKVWLPRSVTFKISLKSPIMRRGRGLDYWKFEISHHTFALYDTSQGLYMLINVQSSLSIGKVPLISTQCRVTMWELMVNMDLIHMNSIPPGLPIDGLKSHSMSSDFQHVRTIFWLISSIFVSWMNTKVGSWIEISFLSELLSALALIPHIFHDLTFCNYLSWKFLIRT